ncbi:sigma-54-dependent Fis family transcriptional regulator [bacterium]|nr:sigma-54-dependent Fis family transcriptional regulator [bacterium]
MPTILVVDDEANLRRAVCRGLEERGHRTLQAGTLGEARRRLLTESPDAVLLDLKLPDGNGLKLLDELRKSHPETPVVILTAYGDVDSAVRALKAGAEDFFEKPFDLEAVGLILERIFERKRLRDEVASLRERLGEVEPLGDSPAWRTMLETVRRVSPTSATVLLTGESGTGKEVIARTIHRYSGREGEFIAIHAAALPAELLESELFGHSRGAFTGAVKDKPGLFEQADGGTLFLDEIGELPPATQVKLLRVLQEGETVRLGETRARRLDLRLVAATNSDLHAAVTRGDFRPDLYYRLAVVTIELPPLRERGEDVLLLGRHFLNRAAAAHRLPSRRFSHETRRALLNHTWPGNVRELANLCERLVILTQGEEISPEELPAEIGGAGGTDWPPQLPEGMGLDEAVERLERRMLEHALIEAGGVAQRAAEILGIGRGAMQYKLKRYGLG